MKKVIITGVSGFIGRKLAACLIDCGYQVEGSDISRHSSLDSRCRFTSVNLVDEQAIHEWVRSCSPDYLVHLGARTDLLGSSLDDYAANTAGVRNVIRACQKNRSLKMAVFASSRMVCRVDYVPGSYEDYCPPNFYGQSKVETEKIVRTSGLHVPWVLVRPTSIWGPGFGIPYRNFFDQVRKRRYFHPAGYRPRKSFGYVGNTVFQLTKLLEADPRTIGGRTFYLGDYSPLDVLEWANYIHSAFGYLGSVREVSFSALKIAALAGDVFNKVTAADRAPLTSFRLNNLVAEMVYPQLAELHEVTGDLPYDWRKGTDETVEWMRQES